MMAKLESVYHAIQHGNAPDSADLLGLLSLESAEDRFRVNQELSKAYFYYIKDLEKALVFAERAFHLCGRSEEFLAYYVELHKATGNLAAQRAAYRIVGIRHAKAGDIYSALRCFNQNRNVYALAGQGNRYAYDLGVLDCIDRLAAKEKPIHKELSTVDYKNKIRIAYLVFHVHHPESVIVKMLAVFAKHHNPAKFDVTFFIAESSITNSEVAVKNIGVLKKAGARVIQADKSEVLDCLRQTANHLQAFDPHVLVVTAILAEYEHYFVASLCSPVVRIGLSYGPPELYIAPRLDWAIASLNTLIIDSPVNGSVVPIEYELPDRQSVTVKSRTDLNIDNDAVVLVSAGRPVKFMSREFWASLIQTLEDHPKAVFIAIGLDEDPAFLSELIPDALTHRVIRLGWQPDYLNVLGMADIVVDTYPSGGGIVLLDAMALSIPVVSFHHDYSQRFDQMNWNLGDDLVPVPELLADRYSLDELRRILSSLIQDQARREQLGGACRAIALEKRGSPVRYVERHEAIYKKVLDLRLRKNADREPPQKSSTGSYLRRLFSRK